MSASKGPLRAPASCRKSGWLQAAELASILHSHCFRKKDVKKTDRAEAKKRKKPEEKHVLVKKAYLKGQKPLVLQWAGTAILHHQ